MRSGIAREAMDLSVRPQDDLFGHVNGTWIAQTQIPPDRVRYGSFDILRERSEEHMRELLADAAAGTDGASSSEVTGEAAGDAALAGALFASFLDEDRAQALGLQPLAPTLEAIEAVRDVPGLLELLGRLQRDGVGGAVEAFVSTDKKNADAYVVYLEQSGLGLPDEAYYTAEQHAGVREAYREHLTRMFTLAGASAEDAAREARDVYALQEALAGGHWDRVRCRDAVATYTPVDRAGLVELAPAYDWAAWARGAGAPDVALDAVVVRQPSYLQRLSQQLAETDLATWKAWLRAAVLHAYAPFLHQEIAAEDFDFYGRTLTGTPEQRARWRRGIALVDHLVGEAAGQLYVRRHFPPEAKERAQELVANLVEAYRRDIAELAWMTPATREKALEKLELFTPKIGYPERWRDYSGLQLSADDLLGNVRAAYAFETDRMWRKLGSPVDRDEWFMTPQTVNAYYNPGMNEIVFPAAILQPPFFDAGADDAANYGAIGSVIGHEIGHGFDDQGSRYDGHGELVDWWTTDDRAAFEQLAGALIEQYDGFSPRDLPGESVNGALTVGENIGDLGGVTIAYLAYRIALDGEDPPVLDGMTGEQRFFAGWAQIWRMRAREQEARRLLAIDPHSPGEFRANIVRNLTEFYEAYDVREGDALWLPPERRVRIW